MGTVNTDNSLTLASRVLRPPTIIIVYTQIRAKADTQFMGGRLTRLTDCRRHTRANTADNRPTLSLTSRVG